MDTEAFTPGVPKGIQYGSEGIDRRFRQLYDQRLRLVAQLREQLPGLEDAEREAALTAARSEIAKLDASEWSLIAKANWGFWSLDQAAQITLANLQCEDPESARDVREGKWALRTSDQTLSLLQAQLSSMDESSIPGARRLEEEEHRSTTELRGELSTQTYRWPGCKHFHARREYVTFPDPAFARRAGFDPQFITVRAWWPLITSWVVLMAANLISLHAGWVTSTVCPQALALPLLETLTIVSFGVSIVSYLTFPLHPGNRWAVDGVLDQAQLTRMSATIVGGAALIFAALLKFGHVLTEVSAAAHQDLPHPNFFDILYVMCLGYTGFMALALLILRHRARAYISGIIWVLRFSERAISDWKATIPGRRELLERINLHQKVRLQFSTSPSGLLGRLYKTLDHPTVH